MRTNKKTIHLAIIRRYIREAIKWHEVNGGMPEFYTSEDYRRSKKVKNPTIGDYPYYVKTDRAIADIAKKIYDLKVK